MLKYGIENMQLFLDATKSSAELGKTQPRILWAKTQPTQTARHERYKEFAKKRSLTIKAQSSSHFLPVHRSSMLGKLQRLHWQQIKLESMKLFN
jgi:hypothetical protein